MTMTIQSETPNCLAIVGYAVKEGIHKAALFVSLFHCPSSVHHAIDSLINTKESSHRLSYKSSKHREDATIPTYLLHT